MTNYTFDRNSFPDMDWEFIDDVIGFCQEKFDDGIQNVIISADSIDDNEGLWGLFRGILMVVDNEPLRYSQSFPKTYEDMAIHFGMRYFNHDALSHDTGWCNLQWYKTNGYSDLNTLFVSYQDLCGYFHGVKTDIASFFDTILFGEV